MRNAITFGTFLAVAVTLSGAGNAAGKEPLYEGLGAHKRTVTTTSPETQQYFDQGLGFLQGFNHGAAIRAFEEAVRIDPSCAMAHWGIAYANGPHINMPMMSPQSVEAAWKEVGLARKCVADGKASDVERDLIEALAQRYSEKPVEDRMPLDKAYAEAMRGVWAKYPKDADVGVWFAESMMDLRPWDQWTPEGTPQPGTEEVVATLDAVLKLDVNHPMANHLYIHAVEASPEPSRANAAADRLRDLQPGVAHNVHMPSHIDIRCGRWQQAIDTNARAVEADRKYREAAGPAKGFLNVYVAHNRHMLAYAAMMTGQGELAVREMRAMVAGMPPEFVHDFGVAVGPAAAMPTEVLVRFGRWDEVLAEPEVSGEHMEFARAFRHAARGIALAAKGDVAAARREQREYAIAREKIPAETMVMGNNHAEIVCAVITAMLEGEIRVREGKVAEGIASLLEAVRVEDQFKYDEPPGWLIPVRHSLGAVLVKEKKFAEAEQVYREDLKRLPENGWSLYGLAESLRQQGKDAEAAQVDERFKKAWANADVEIKDSRLCQAGG